MAQYIVQYCTTNEIPVEALLCDDHTVVNPKPSNDGVNMWMTSALSTAYVITGSESLRVLAEAIYDYNATSFMKAGDNYHWFAVAADVLHKDP